MHDLADDGRVARLEKAVAATGWRTMRSDGATGVEVAIVAEEFGRGLVDVPFSRARARRRPAPRGAADGDPGWTIAVDGVAADARGIDRALVLSGHRLLAARSARSGPEPT